MSILPIEVNYSKICVKYIYICEMLCGEKEIVILFRQACVSLSQVLWHSMDLTSSQHNHLQNELIKERQEGKCFLFHYVFSLHLGIFLSIMNKVSC